MLALIEKSELETGLKCCSWSTLDLWLNNNAGYQTSREVLLGNLKPELFYKY